MDNRIETIPEEFGESLRLEHLSFFGNPLREVPAALLLMDGLEGLDLGRSALTRLPHLEQPSTSIRRLGLDRTEWLEIPESYLANFPNLRSFSLGHSFRHKIPDEVFGLAELIHLDFEGNPLKVLPSQVGGRRNCSVSNFGTASWRRCQKSSANLPSSKKRREAARSASIFPAIRSRIKS